MFLKLRQPIDEMEYPTPRILEGGRSYEYPFTFVVPDRLLPQVCTHPKKNAHIQRSHTMLPPTLGDPILSSNGKTLLDDMAPSMSQIAYTVRASVLQKQLVGPGVVAIAGIAKKVRIIPKKNLLWKFPPVHLSAHAKRRALSVAPCEANWDVSSLHHPNLSPFNCSLQMARQPIL